VEQALHRAKGLQTPHSAPKSPYRHFPHRGPQYPQSGHCSTLTAPSRRAPALPHVHCCVSCAPCAIACDNATGFPPRLCNPLLCKGCISAVWFSEHPPPTALFTKTPPSVQHP
jgi:hypothetical protein